jgi:hypothetical protein
VERRAANRAFAGLIAENLGTAAAQAEMPAGEDKSVAGFGHTYNAFNGATSRLVLRALGCARATRVRMRECVSE